MLMLKEGSDGEERSKKGKNRNGNDRGRRERYVLTYLLTYSLTYLLTHLLTYSLTPWSTVLLEKLTGL
jgi:hypothetical protein